MDEIASFGEWVQIRRETLRLTRKKVAEDLGCASVTIKKIERDERRPSKLIAQLLVVHLEIPTSIESKFIRWARGEFVAGMPAPNQLSLKSESLQTKPKPQKSNTSNNLPKLTTSFIGRIEELASLSDLFENRKVRLITLVGPGGIGKTRLAHQAAYEALHQANMFPDGALFIDLANLQTADQLVMQVAAALQLSFSGISLPKDQVRDQLQNKKLLLFLDNFEQLIDSTAALLGEWLQETNHVKFLVTSREPLNLVEEWVVKIEGLSFPRETAVSPTINSLLQLRAPDTPTQTYPSVALFVNRARQVVHDFSLHNDVKAQNAVLQTCRLLEGIPLGIELAAPWVRMMSCEDIAQEIQKSLDFLASKHRNIDSRHGSMRAVFEQSWRLLTAVEQALLAQLSVFNGRFQREAAMTICDASLFDLVALVDKSLIQTTDNHTFRLHQLLKQFATEKLPTDETETVRHAHARYYANYLSTIDLYAGAQSKNNDDLIKQNIENIRTGWNWAIKNANLQILDQYLEPLYRFYGMQAWWHEGLMMFQKAAILLRPERTISTLSHQQIRFFTRFMPRFSEFHYALGYLDHAERTLKKSIQLTLLLEEADEVALVNKKIGMIAYQRGNFTLALDHLTLTISILEESKVQSGDLAHAYMSMGAILRDQGSKLEAQNLFSQSISIYKELGLIWGVAHATRLLANLTFQLDDISGAKVLHQKSIDLFEQIDNQLGVGLNLIGLGQIATDENEVETAEKQLLDGLKYCEQVDDQMGITIALLHLGELMIVQEAWQATKKYLQDCFNHALQIQATTLILQVIFNIALLLLKSQPREAIGNSVKKLLMVIYNHPLCIPSLKSEVEQILSQQDISPLVESVKSIEKIEQMVEKSLSFISY